MSNDLLGSSSGSFTSSSSDSLSVSSSDSISGSVSGGVSGSSYGGTSSDGLQTAVSVDNSGEPGGWICDEDWIDCSFSRLSLVSCSDGTGLYISADTISVRKVPFSSAMVCSMMCVRLICNCLLYFQGM